MHVYAYTHPICICTSNHTHTQYASLPLSTVHTHIHTYKPKHTAPAALNILPISTNARYIHTHKRTYTHTHRVCICGSLDIAFVSAKARYIHTYTHTHIYTGCVSAGLWTSYLSQPKPAWSLPPPAERAHSSSHKCCTQRTFSPRTPCAPCRHPPAAAIVVPHAAITPPHLRNQTHSQPPRILRAPRPYIAPQESHIWAPHPAAHTNQRESRF
jgi:hypothetical protein